MFLAGEMKAQNTLLLYYLLSNICKIHRSDEADFSSSLPCNNKNKQESLAIAKMTARCALYISYSP